MLKAVLMDIDDTLLDFGKCAEQAMRIGFAEWGLPYDDSTYATFTRINDGLAHDRARRAHHAAAF